MLAGPSRTPREVSCNSAESGSFEEKLHRGWFHSFGNRSVFRKGGRQVRQQDSAWSEILKGKVAVVTAGRGIGRSAAVALARSGANVAGIDICATVDPRSGVTPTTKAYLRRDRTTGQGGGPPLEELRGRSARPNYSSRHRCTDRLTQLDESLQ
jgi:hypothetical protein